MRQRSASLGDATPGLCHIRPIISAGPLARGPAGGRPPLSVASSSFPQCNPWPHSTQLAPLRIHLLLPSRLLAFHCLRTHRFQGCDISTVVACYTRFPLRFSGSSHVVVMTRSPPKGQLHRPTTHSPHNRAPPFPDCRESDSVLSTRWVFWFFLFGYYETYQ